MSENNRIVKTNFFNGQQLSAEEFKINSNYYTSMRYRQNSMLLNYGIIDGLTVEQDPGNGLTIVVKKGMAIANFYNGNEPVAKEIILGNNIKFSLSSFAEDLEVDNSIDLAVSVAFNEFKATEDTYRGSQFIRIIEKPVVQIDTDLSQVDYKQQIIVALVTINKYLDNSGNIVSEVLISSKRDELFPLFPDETDIIIPNWLSAGEGFTKTVTGTTTDKSKLEVKWLSKKGSGEFTFDSEVSNDDVNKIEILDEELNGLPVISFNDNSILKEPGNIKKVQEIFIVCYFDTGDDQESTLLTISTASKKYYIRRDIRGGYRTDSDNEFAKVADPGNPSTGEGRIFLNGIKTKEFESGKWHVLDIVSGSQITDVTGITLGAVDDQYNKNWVGKIAEVIFFEDTLEDRIYNQDKVLMRDGVLSYLKLKYDIDSYTVQPESEFSVASGIINKLNLFDNDTNDLIDDTKSTLSITGEEDKRISVTADKVVLKTHNNEKIEVVFENQLDVIGDFTVEGNLNTLVEKELTTNILSNDLIINDNIITLNYQNNSATESGIEVYKGKNLDGVDNSKPYIKWNETSCQWVASDAENEVPNVPFKTGAIAFGLDDNLTDGTNADNLHKHSVLTIDGEADKSLKVTYENGTDVVTIGDIEPESDKRLLVNGTIKANSIQFYDKSVFPENPAIDSANYQFDDYQYQYTSVLDYDKIIADGNLPSTELENAIKHNASILLVGSKTGGSFELSVETSIKITDINNLSITCTDTTLLSAVSATVFDISGDCKNIKIININSSSVDTLVRQRGTTTGLVIMGCRNLAEVEASTLLDIQGNITNCVVKNNEWRSASYGIINFTSSQVKDCIISNNKFICDDNITKRVSVVLLYDVVAENLTISGNIIRGKISAIILNLMEDSIAVDISDNIIDLEIEEDHEFVDAVTVYYPSETLNPEVFSINSNKIRMVPGHVFNRGISISNISEVVLANNIINFNDQNNESNLNAVGIEAVNLKNSIVANNTLAGVVNFRTPNNNYINENNNDVESNFVLENNINSCNNFSYKVLLYEVLNDLFTLTGADNVSVTTNDNENNNILLVKNTVDAAGNESEPSEITIPDEFPNYTVQLSKTGYNSHVIDKYTKAGLLSTVPYKWQFTNPFSFQVQVYQFLDDIKTIITDAKFNITAGMNNVPLVVDSISMANDSAVAFDSDLNLNILTLAQKFSSYNLVISKDGINNIFDSSAVPGFPILQAELEEYSEVPLQVELLNTFNIQLQVFHIEENVEVLTGSVISVNAVDSLEDSRQNIRTIIVNQSFTVQDYENNIINLEVIDGYNNYEVIIEKTGYDSEILLLTNSEIKALITNTEKILIKKYFNVKLDIFTFQDTETTVKEPVEANVNITAGDYDWSLNIANYNEDYGFLRIVDGITGYEITIESIDSGYEQNPEPLIITNENFKLAAANPLEIEIYKTFSAAAQIRTVTDNSLQFIPVTITIEGVDADQAVLKNISTGYFDAEPTELLFYDKYDSFHVRAEISSGEIIDKYLSKVELTAAANLPIEFNFLNILNPQFNIVVLSNDDLVALTGANLKLFNEYDNTIYYDDTYENSTAIEVVGGYDFYTVVVSHDGFEATKTFSGDSLVDSEIVPVEIELVKTFDTSVKVFALQNDSLEQVSANLEVKDSSETLTLTNVVLSPALELFPVKSGYSDYSLTISKEGYETKTWLEKSYVLEGYADDPLSVEVIKYFTLQVEVMDENGTLTTAILTVEKEIDDGEKTLVSSIGISAGTNEITVKDGYNNYRIIVSKDGYQDYSELFSRAALVSLVQITLEIL